MRKVLLIELVALVAIVAAGTGTAAAQATKDKPTFDETIQYLKGFLATHGCTEYDRPDTHGQDCKFITKSDGCTLYGEEKYYDNAKDSPDPPDVKLEQWSLDLGALDPFSPESTTFFQHDDGSRNDGLSVTAQNQTGGGMSFPVDSANDATHLIKALKRAITLCGGKKAPF
jgi:hypothetical protein